MVEQSHTAGWWPNVYEPLRALGQKVADWFAPPSDASALESHYEINMELPGIKAEDVDISLHDGGLTVSGEKHTDREESGRSFFFSERQYGSFQRTFRLPPDADADKVDAQFGDGVLTLKIARRNHTESSAKKIEIRKI